MVTASEPTKHTWHVDIRCFALIQRWAKTGQLRATLIPTAQNISDSLTKATGRVKFHQHADIFMGRQRLHYGSALHGLSSTSLNLLHPQPHILSTVAITPPHDHIPYDMAKISALHFPIIHQSILAVFASTVQSTGGWKGYSSGSTVTYFSRITITRTLT
jgi:hypothetical protein